MFGGSDAAYFFKGIFMSAFEKWIVRLAVALSAFGLIYSFVQYY